MPCCSKVGCVFCAKDTLIENLYEKVSLQLNEKYKVAIIFDKKQTKNKATKSKNYGATFKIA